MFKFLKKPFKRVLFRIFTPFALATVLIVLAMTVFKQGDSNAVMAAIFLIPVSTVDLIIYWIYEKTYGKGARKDTLLNVIFCIVMAIELIVALTIGFVAISQSAGDGAWALGIGGALAVGTAGMAFIYVLSARTSFIKKNAFAILPVFVYLIAYLLSSILFMVVTAGGFHPVHIITIVLFVASILIMVFKGMPIRYASTYSAPTPKPASKPASYNKPVTEASKQSAYNILNEYIKQWLAKDVCQKYSVTRFGPDVKATVTAKHTIASGDIKVDVLFEYNLSREKSVYNSVKVKALQDYLDEAGKAIKLLSQIISDEMMEAVKEVMRQAGPIANHGTGGSLDWHSHTSISVRLSQDIKDLGVVFHTAQ